MVCCSGFLAEGGFSPNPFQYETNMKGLLIGLIPWVGKGTHEDFIFIENSFKFISCCFLIIKSTRFQLQHFNLEHLEITLTKLMFITATTT